MDTNSFLNALYRFMARRGQPEVIRCDMGTNFVGAKNELRKCQEEWDQNKISHEMNWRNIEWKFNSPDAPHMGGVWESMVKSVKSVLMSLMDNPRQTIDDEGLNTLFSQCEAIVNSRPITFISNEPNDPCALTPNHLLLLRADVNAQPIVTDVTDVYRRSWRQVQYLTQIFWSRWRKEYLSSLQRRQKWTATQRNVQVGDVVVIDDKTPRNEWALGRVTQLLPSSDNLVRRVMIQSRGKTFERPIHRLVFVEAGV
jgi:hypothetical protein